MLLPVLEDEIGLCDPHRGSLEVADFNRREMRTQIDAVPICAALKMAQMLLMMRAWALQRGNGVHLSLHIYNSMHYSVPHCVKHTGT